MSERLRDLSSGFPVLVYRTKCKRVEDPFRFILVDGETTVVQMTRVRRIFWSSCANTWKDSVLRNHHEKDKAKKDSEVRTDQEVSKEKIEQVLKV